MSQRVFTATQTFTVLKRVLSLRKLPGCVVVCSFAKARPTPATLVGVPVDPTLRAMYAAASGLRLTWSINQGPFGALTVHPLSSLYVKAAGGSRKQRSPSSSNASPN